MMMHLMMMTILSERAEISDKKTKQMHLGNASVPAEKAKKDAKAMQSGSDVRAGLLTEGQTGANC